MLMQLPKVHKKMLMQLPKVRQKMRAPQLKLQLEKLVLLQK
jgi:hypothetical protein